jgi:hypothetical protein
VQLRSPGAPGSSTCRTSHRTPRDMIVSCRC